MHLQIMENPNFRSSFCKKPSGISLAEPSLTHQLLFFHQQNEIRKLLYYPLKPLFQNILTPFSFCDFMKPGYYIIGSINGLLCDYDSRQHYFRLWNPSIRFKSKESPEVVSRGLTIMQYGFGYDQLNDKYKVVVLALNKNDTSQFLTKIYTFGEDSWKSIPNFWPIMHSRSLERLGKFVCGNLNWIVKKRGVSSNQNVILSFDLEKETYKEMLLPQNDGDKFYGDTLYVLNNCLGVGYQTNQTHWVVWLMKEYGVIESWTKFMIIPLDMSNERPPIVIPIFVSENDDVILLNIYTSQLMLYNLNSGQFINSLDDPLKSTSTRRFDLYIYCESLISLPS